MIPGGLIELGRFLLGRDNAQGLLQKPAGLLAFAALVALGLDARFALGRDDDFDDS